MIAGFKDKEAELLFKIRRASKRLAPCANAALRKLVVIDAATSIAGLRNPPGNDLKQIGNVWQVRINRQYRVRFTWDGRDADDVEIGDFHESKSKGQALLMKHTTTKIKPTHPGDVLRHEYLEPLGMTPNALALAIRVPASRVGEIVNGKRSITAPTAMRLARYFGNSARFWINLQSYYDLAIAEDELSRDVERDVQPRQTATA